MVTANRNRSNIYAWEPGNELKTSRPTFIAFMQAMSAEIRSLDSVHSIATGMKDAYHVDASGPWDIYPQLPLFDVLTVHMYHGDREGGPDADWAAANGRRLWVEEMGYDSHLVPYTGPPACDPDHQLNMSVSVNPAMIGDSVTFTVGGGQGLTYLDDAWNGGVSCSGGFWGSKTCQATTAGSFVWTHYWRNCASNNCASYSELCSKSTSFEVRPATNPRPSPYATPTPGPPTPTPTAVLERSVPLNAEIGYWQGHGAVAFAQWGFIAGGLGDDGDGDRKWGMDTIWHLDYPALAGLYTSFGPPTATPTSTPSPTPVACLSCASDINGDGNVTISDFSRLRACFGQSPGSTDLQGHSCARCDIFPDGSIDMLDFSCFRMRFGQAVAPSCLAPASGAH